MQQINNSKPPENKSLALHFECEAILSIKTKVDNIGGTIKVGVITQWYYGMNTRARHTKQIELTICMGTWVVIMTSCTKNQQAGF